MKYDRFVHIIKRDDKIKAVFTARRAAYKAYCQMCHEAKPVYTPDQDLEEYLLKCDAECNKWQLEKWPVCKTMDT